MPDCQREFPWPHDMGKIISVSSYCSRHVNMRYGVPGEACARSPPTAWRFLCKHHPCLPSLVSVNKKWKHQASEKEPEEMLPVTSPCCKSWWDGCLPGSQASWAGSEIPEASCTVKVVCLSSICGGSSGGSSLTGKRHPVSLIFQKI